MCGMHRSGTSAMSRLAAAYAGWSLMDDPQWAIDHGPSTYKSAPEVREAVAVADIVKCPRMSAVLPDVLKDFAPARAVFMLRDPRDVWRSIQEKVALGRPTRMLTFAEVEPDGGPEALRDAYSHYVDVASQVDLPVRVVPYDVFFVARVECAAFVSREAGAQSRWSCHELMDT